MQVSVLRSSLVFLASGACALGACSAVREAETRGGANSSSAFAGPQFAGAGVAGLGQSLAAGVPALSCGDPSSFSFTNGPAPGARSHLSCFYGAHSDPDAAVEWIVESSKEDGDLVHIRLTLNPEFCDNTYGANCIGWPAKGGPGGMMKPPAGMMMTPPGGMTPPPMMTPPPPPAGMAGMKGPMGPMDDKAPHTFKDLVESDHAEFKLSDADGKLVLHFKEDYISASGDAPSGWATLGVTGGEGRVLAGDSKAFVAFSTSLDRDLNACGLSSFTTDSPATDANYTPAKGAEAWDYRVVYDVWVSADAFGAAGFGDAIVDFVHASPSKLPGPTQTVTRKPCPPTWKHYCDNPAGCKTDKQCGENPDDNCPPQTMDKPDAGSKCGDQPDDSCGPQTVDNPDAGTNNVPEGDRPI